MVKAAALRGAVAAACCVGAAARTGKREVVLNVFDEAGAVQYRTKLHVTKEDAPKVVEEFCSAHDLTTNSCQSLHNLVQHKAAAKEPEQSVSIQAGDATVVLEIGEWRQHTADIMATRTYKGNFNPIAVWHTRQTAVFEDTLRHLRDAPVRILEIGSYEGLSATWFMLYFNSASTMTCVDTWRGDVDTEVAAGARWQRFLANTAFARSRIATRVGRSVRTLYGLDPGSYDIAYVDGAHEAPDALSDMVMAFRLLKPGGVMLVDDVLLFPGGEPPESESERHNNVDVVWPAVEAFLHVYQGRVKVLQEGNQVHLQRLV